MRAKSFRIWMVMKETCWQPLGFLRTVSSEAPTDSRIHYLARNLSDDLWEQYPIVK